MDDTLRLSAAEPAERESLGMLRRKLQATGGTGGTLFSALMLVIIVMCFVTYCYRRSIYNFNNRAAADVEVITETNAEITEGHSNFAEVGECHLESRGIRGNTDESELDSSSERSKKKNLSERMTSNKNNENTTPSPINIQIAIAYEYDLSRIRAGVTQARSIRVMESFQSSPPHHSTNGDDDHSPSSTSTDHRSSLFDHDYLIETERNMFEFNSDFVRLSSEAAAAAAAAAALNNTDDNSRHEESNIILNIR